MSGSEGHSVTPPAPPAVGEVLAGKYRVDRVLGRGGMGFVVAATHLQLDEPVAMKFLHAAVAKDPDLVMRFQREAKAARKIRSEHVVRILDVGELETGAPYMVMEYLDGTDLDRLVKRGGPQSVPNAVDYLLQACEALAEAHVQGMVHRDLKPANLFVSKRADGTALVKVLDFGISKVTGAGGADLGMTKTNSAVLGSPLYMAPEQMRSLRGVDARTDIWALGVILYELLTGIPPFNATTLPELCATILQDPAPSAGESRRDVPTALDAAIKKCLAKDPADRFGDVAALALELAPFGSQAGRASAHRIVGVYRTAGLDISSTADTPPIESIASPFASTAIRDESTGPTKPPPPAKISNPPTVSESAAAITGKNTGRTAWGNDDAPAPATSAPSEKRRMSALVPVLATLALVGVVVGFLVVRTVGATTPTTQAAHAEDAAVIVQAPPPPSIPAPPVVVNVNVEVEVDASVAPVVVPAPAVQVRVPPTPPIPPVVVPVKPKVDCTVAYEYDANGKKTWKRECLDK